MKLCSSGAFSWSLARKYIQPDLGEECAFADDALRVFPGPLFVELGGGFGEQKLLLISSTSNSQAQGHGVSMLCLQLWLGAVLGGLFDYFFPPPCLLQFFITPQFLTVESVAAWGVNVGI